VVTLYYPLYALFLVVFHQFSLSTQTIAFLENNTYNKCKSAVLKGEKEVNTISINGGTTNKVGRPTKYDPTTMPDKAYKLCILGLTNIQLAAALDVSVSSIDKWLVEHEEFSSAVKKGREEADYDVVRSLYQRAMGYSHPEDKILVVNKQVEVISTTKHYPPDTLACIFWLKNRRKEQWRDVSKIEHSGDDGKPINVKLELSKQDLSDFTEEELLVLEKTIGKLHNGEPGGNEHIG